MDTYLKSSSVEPVQNEPVSYDDHGDIPFEVPFEDIPYSEISIYLQLNTKVGKTTCRQTCAHCFFINQPEARGRSMDLKEGHKVMDDLVALGYKVFPMISDSFASKGEFLWLFGNSHNRDLRQEIDRKLTKTMERGELWTSGAPLLDEDWEEMLCLSVENGFGSITMTFHGMLNEDLQLHTSDTYPIKNVFPAHDCEKVIKRISYFNERLQTDAIPRLVSLPTPSKRPLQINLGVTLGRHNHSRRDLLRYVEYFNRRPIAVVRFNCFHDHGWRHPHLTLTRDEIAQVYANLHWIHANIKLHFQLGIDEDFGTSGIEVMEFPSHTGWCRAGRQLFAIVPDDRAVVLHQDARERIEKVGTIAGCVDAFKPIVGDLIRRTDKTIETISYSLVFFHDVIAELNRKRLEGIYTNGCYADEMLDEYKHGVTMIHNRNLNP
jgi:hypothetical protein